MGAAHRILPCIASSGLLDRRRDTLAHRSGSAVVSSYRCRRSADDDRLALQIPSCTRGKSHCSISLNSALFIEYCSARQRRRASTLTFGRKQCDSYLKQVPDVAFEGQTQRKCWTDALLLRGTSVPSALLDKAKETRTDVGCSMRSTSSYWLKQLTHLFATYISKAAHSKQPVNVHLFLLEVHA
ncbi:uncharacterized protein BT62DRAFT_1073993 [Guyanagaster necrorhizus]|uniref:Uncharacterized protein n=1 Tax=Guyanagaster necrorhizus TaxID=856835 RepID=A0A9P7VW34_9AGAR|nr:uncharacterized protein BT62DRAFT_1073993 [Guyanagaster necrorhizus MCA 3950]KAG7448408.1 hypothetical protein BT62DRAFT_1073993 [Guyanagaster necrorhizus MCA 3950]